MKIFVWVDAEKIEKNIVKQPQVESNTTVAFVVPPTQRKFSQTLPREIRTVTPTDLLNDIAEAGSGDGIVVMHAGCILTMGWEKQVFAAKRRFPEAELLTAMEISAFQGGKLDTVVQMSAEWDIAEYSQVSECGSSAFWIADTFCKRLHDCFLPTTIERFPDFACWLETTAAQRGVTEILCGNWWVKDDTNQKFCNKLPLKEFQYNYDMFQRLQSSKRNILYLVQNDFSEGADRNIGGTQFHVKDMMRGLREHYNVYVAARDGGFLRVTRYDDGEPYIWLIFLGPEPPFDRVCDIRQTIVYAAILDVLQIDIVHIHHTKGLSLDLFCEAKKRNLPLMFTFHDFYTVCPSIKLLDAENNLCIGVETKERCKVCMKKRLGISDGDEMLNEWRTVHSNALQYCDCFFAPSESARNIIATYWPDIASKIAVIPHGIERANRESQLVAACKHSRLQVAFLGSLSIEKGSRTAIQLIVTHPEVDWHVFGGVEDAELQSIKRKNLIFHGWYQRENLQVLLSENAVDLICILPILPETFGYTLSEALMCEIPVIVANIGALGERAQKLHSCWTVNATDPVTETTRIIEQIQSNPQILQEKKETAQKQQIRTLTDMTKDYERVYQQSFRQKQLRQATRAQVALLHDGRVMAQKLLFGETVDTNDSLKAQCVFLQSQLDEIHNSNSYRLIQKMKRWGLFRLLLAKIRRGTQNAK